MAGRCGRGIFEDAFGSGQCMDAEHGKGEGGSWQVYLISEATTNQNIKILSVEVWTDTVKLYYGSCREDAPFLRLGR